MSWLRVQTMCHPPRRYGPRLWRARTVFTVSFIVVNTLPAGKVEVPVLRSTDNGRTYLWKMVFGNPGEPHHTAALGIVAQIEIVIAAVLRRYEPIGEVVAAAPAHVVSAIMFLAMAAIIDIARSVGDLTQDIRCQVYVKTSCMQQNAL